MYSPYAAMGNAPSMMIDPDGMRFMLSGATPMNDPFTESELQNLARLQMDFAKLVNGTIFVGGGNGGGGGISSMFDNWSGGASGNLLRMGNQLSVWTMLDIAKGNSAKGKVTLFSNGEYVGTGESLFQNKDGSLRYINGWINIPSVAQNGFVGDYTYIGNTDDDINGYINWVASQYQGMQNGGGESLIPEIGGLKGSFYVGVEGEVTVGAYGSNNAVTAGFLNHVLYDYSFSNQGVQTYNGAKSFAVKTKDVDIGISKGGSGIQYKRYTTEYGNSIDATYNVFSIGIMGIGVEIKMNDYGHINEFFVGGMYSHNAGLIMGSSSTYKVGIKWGK